MDWKQILSTEINQIYMKKLTTIVSSKLWFKMLSNGNSYEGSNLALILKQGQKCDSYYVSYTYLFLYNILW